MALEQISFNNLSTPARHFIIIALILLIAGMWYWVYQKPRNEELATFINSRERLRTQVQQATTVKTMYDQYQSELIELEARLKSLQSIIPTEKEAAEFLETIQDLAAASDLKINYFRPRSLVQRDFYFDWPVDVRVEGNYHGLGSFFEKISQATRIVDIPMVTINNISNQTDSKWTLVANGTVTTYVQGNVSGQNPIKE